MGPMRPPRACRTCQRATENGASYCKEHAADATVGAKVYDKGRSNDAVRKLYNSARWHKFREAILRRNPQCQHIIGEERCHSVANRVHHLLSPKARPDLFTNCANVVAVCASCHQGGQEGETQGYRYTPTRDWFGDLTYSHLDSFGQPIVGLGAPVQAQTP